MLRPPESIHCRRVNPHQGVCREFMEAHERPKLRPLKKPTYQLRATLSAAGQLSF